MRTTTSRPGHVPYVTHMVWDARHRMIFAETPEAKLKWAERYVLFKRLRGDYENKRPEVSPPG
jgi:hypothetical protein